jgi:hypothetical protein
VSLALRPLGFGGVPSLHNGISDGSYSTKTSCGAGNKRDNVTVIYTPWSNLRKDGSMVVGQVSFHDQKKVSNSSVRAANDRFLLGIHRQ